MSIGVLQISVAVSFAALIFDGELAAGVPRVAVSYTIGTGIVLVFVTLLSRMETIVAGAQDTAAVVAAAIAAGIAADAAPDQRVPTVIVALAFAAVLTGVVYLFVGRSRLGEIARSIPFTVISGFLAGTGWLLLRGGVEVMVGRTLAWSDVGDLVGWDMARKWLPGVALAVFIALVLRRGANTAIVGLAILASAVAINLVGRSVSSLTELENGGWLIGPFPAGQRLSPILPSDLADTDWGAVAAQALPIAGLVAVSVVGVLLNLSGLGVACEEHIDIDHELKVAGGANVLNGLAGGMIGYHLIGDTVIARQFQARGRSVPLLIGAMIVVVVIWGDRVVALMPRAVAGGVLAAVGLSLLITWIQQVTSRLSRVDAVLSGVILAVIIAFGVLPGIAAGVLASTVVFAISYSRLSPIRRVHRLSTTQSNVDRCEAERKLLVDADESMLVLELEGYLFFGTIRRMADLIDPLMQHHELRYLVVDLRAVRGIDSSVIAGLVALVRRASDNGVAVMWSDVRVDLAEQLERGGVVLHGRFADLDHAIEHVEDLLLDGFGIVEMDAALENWLAAIKPFGRTLQLDVGDVLVEAGDSTSELFVIVSGRLTAWGEVSTGGRVRYRSVGPGSLLGEMAFTTGSPRTADVVADDHAVVIGIDRDTLRRMDDAEPELATATRELVAVRLAERLASTSRRVRSLLS